MLIIRTGNLPSTDLPASDSSTMQSTAEIIRSFNAGRDTERLAMKYQNMQSSPFSFLRGTCHLFHAQLPITQVLAKAPATWLCGDLHLENFGSYKGDNRLAYFDQNDFDETALAPCTWDALRLATSVLVASHPRKGNSSPNIALAKAFLKAYSDTLAEGKVRWIERDTADGPIRELLNSVRQRTRADFLELRTEVHRRHRRIRLDGRKALPASEEQREHIFTFMEKFAAEQEHPEFFSPLDVARRIAGTGSLGVDRYVILIHGKGSPDGNYLLDLKQALPSAPAAYSKITQPTWKNEAERIVTIQRQAQAIPMAFLNPVLLNNNAYILRCLQPSEDRISLRLKPRMQPANALLLQDMGRITAWAHLRSSGRRGAAIADELMEFGASQNWQKELLEVATVCYQQTLQDWQEFRHACDDGFFA